MANIRVSTHIDAPPEAVFDFIDQWQNAKRYMERMVRYELVDPEGGTGVGAEFLIAVEAAGHKLNGHIRVTEHDRPHRIAFKTIEGVRVVGAWTITQDGDGSRLVLESDYEPPGGLIGRLVASFIKGNAENDLRRSLANLKRMVEAESAA